MPSGDVKSFSNNYFGINFIKQDGGKIEEPPVRINIHMDEVLCFLCLTNLSSSKSRINVRGRSSFPIEQEIRKLPISPRIDDNTRICPGCLRKLRRKKTIEENLQEAMRDLVKNYNPDPIGSSLPDDQCATKDNCVPDHTDFTPLFKSTPTKKSDARSNGSAGTCQTRQTEPGVTVSKFASLLIKPIDI
jgi:hypothetical protein